MGEKKWVPVLVIIITGVIGIFHGFNLSGFVIQSMTPFYLMVVPGFTFIQFLEIGDIVAEFALGITLSLIIITIIPMLMVYLNFWHPNLGLWLILSVTFVSASIQVFRNLSWR